MSQPPWQQHHQPPLGWQPGGGPPPWQQQQHMQQQHMQQPPMGGHMQQPPTVGGWQAGGAAPGPVGAGVGPPMGGGGSGIAAAAAGGAGAAAPWEQPVAPTPPPADEQAANTIRKLAGYVIKNGADFERMMKDKQSNNTKFSFLFGGEGFDYYRWCKHTAQAGMTDVQIAAQVAVHQSALVNQPSGGPGGGGGAGAASRPAALSPQQRTELETLLAGLSGTKENIKAGHKWIIEHPTQVRMDAAHAPRRRGLMRQARYPLLFCCAAGAGGDGPGRRACSARRHLRQEAVRRVRHQRCGPPLQEGARGGGGGGQRR
jgi:hypothetical protein